LEAFAIVSGELRDARLFIQADAECIQPLFEKASALGVTSRIHAVSRTERERALAEADVVLALSREHAETTVLTGLVSHRAILAADVPTARDASADGRGVLWFRPGDVRDLALRAVFLARNPDFRVALARAGQNHLLETRTPEAVARRYHAIYRHAWERRRSGPPMSGFNWQPLTACL
jgi:glycosyltransferase involved in cell wall biosynthesis